MPERAEVHFFCQQFLEFFPIGTRLLRMTGTAGYPVTIPASDLPLTIESATTRGKNMFIHFTNGYSFHIHFGMTAGFRLQPHPNTRYQLQFDVAPYDYYWISVRKFACEKLNYVKRSELAPIEGFDIMLDDPSDEAVWAARPPRGRKIGTMLLDQGPFLGIGNYLRAMICYRGKISPFRNTNTMTKDEFVSLFRIAQNIIKEILAHGAFSVYSLRLANDEELFSSYDATPYRCPTDHQGNPVQKDELPKGRSIYWVPAIQK